MLSRSSTTSFDNGNVLVLRLLNRRVEVGNLLADSRQRCRNAQGVCPSARHVLAIETVIRFELPSPLLS